MADKNGRVFDEEDELVVATLAAQASVSLHNTAAYQREHAIAETFQRALLMQPPAIPGIEVGVQYRAATEVARVGGDFYDLVMLGPGRLMVIVGDVCGKSLSAGRRVGRGALHAAGLRGRGSPGEALSRLNSAVIDQLPGQPFVTLVVAYVDVARHMFEYAVAGHPRPVVLAGHNEFPLPVDGHLPVGIFRGNVYPTNRAVLPDDSSIVLYTDGMTDARTGGATFGEQRLRETIAKQPAPAGAGARRHAARRRLGLRRRRAAGRLRHRHDQAPVGRAVSRAGRPRGARPQAPTPSARRRWRKRKTPCWSTKPSRRPASTTLPRAPRPARP